MSYSMAVGTDNLVHYAEWLGETHDAELWSVCDDSYRCSVISMVYPKEPDAPTCLWCALEKLPKRARRPPRKPVAAIR